MATQERHHDARRDDLPQGSGGDPPPPDLTPVREQGRRLITTGVARDALTGDSDGFSRDNIQGSGQ
jgi:hypothetical protein